MHPNMADDHRPPQPQRPSPSLEFDDPTLPVWTFRCVVIGFICLSVLALTATYSSFRYASVALSVLSLEVVIYTVADFMARVLPHRMMKIPFTDFRFSMNPGQFNIKEHFIMSMFASHGEDAAYTMALVVVAKSTLHKDVSQIVAYLFVITNQMMGYGKAGVHRGFFVKSPLMRYPSTADEIAFLKAAHDGSKRRRGCVSSFQFLLLAITNVITFSTITQYFAPSLSVISTLCMLITKKTVLIHQLGSGLYGLGIGSFTLDWSTVSAFLPSVFTTPFSTSMNTMVGFVIMAYILSPASYFRKGSFLRRFPLWSAGFFTDSGKSYEFKKILDPKTLDLIEQNYKDYSKVHMSVMAQYAVKFDIAAVASSLTYVGLYHAKDAFAYVDEESNDPDNVAMRNYEDIPTSWFDWITAITTGILLIVCTYAGKDFQLTFWLGILAIFVIYVTNFAVTLLYATTGQTLFLQTLSGIIAGFAFVGKPIANIAFKAIVTSSAYHTQKSLYNYKMGHYLRIPPKTNFLVQVTGAFISNSIQFIAAWTILSIVPNVCDPELLPTDSPWMCPGPLHVLNVSYLMGAVGPKEVFSVSGMEYSLIIYTVIGFLATFVVWLIQKKFSRDHWVSKIHVPTILNGPCFIPNAGSIHYWSWFAFSFIFNFVVFKNFRGWWASKNVLLGDAFDIGTKLLSLLISLSLQVNKTRGLNSSNARELDTACDKAGCPGIPVVEAPAASPAESPTGCP